MSRTLKRKTLFGAVLGSGATFALVVGLGVLAGSGAAASAVAPVNTSPPTVTGTPQQGQTLTGDKGTFSNNPIDYNYFWERCHKNGSGCSNIGGASGLTYLLTSADVDKRLRFKVQATNSDGTVFASSAPTSVVTAAANAPVNTSPPTVIGTPQEGERLTGDRGSFSNHPNDYNYFWERCDKNGASCANIGGATGSIYRLTSADVGSTLRFKVQATNSNGTTFASSVPTAVVSSAKVSPPPSATGCPPGSGAVQVSAVNAPARLLLDAQQSNPQIVRSGTQQITVRYHVSDTCGQSVGGALVYATAVPFSQLTIPAEQMTSSDGWATLDFRSLAGFPVSPRQQLIAVFVRARKSGENILAGISARRLFSIPVNLH